VCVCKIIKLNFVKKPHKSVHKHRDQYIEKVSFSGVNIHYVHMILYIGKQYISIIYGTAAESQEENKKEHISVNLVEFFCRTSLSEEICASCLHCPLSFANN